MFLCLAVLLGIWLWLWGIRKGRGNTGSVTMPPATRPGLELQPPADTLARAAAQVPRYRGTLVTLQQLSLSFVMQLRYSRWI